MADGFIWYELVTNDMDKAVSFYSKVVGWDVKDAGMPGFTNYRARLDARNSENLRLRPIFVAASSSAACVKKNTCFGLELG